MNQTTRLLCFLLLPFGLTSSFASSSEEARHWIEKLAVLYTTTFKADFDMTFAGNEKGITRGTMTVGPDQKMRMVMDLKTKEAGQTVEIKMLYVSDGKDLWIEMNIPSQGIQQIMTISLEMIQKMAGMNHAFAMVGQDPGSQVKKLAENLDFLVSKKEAGRVSLIANPTPEQLKEVSGGTDLQSLGAYFSRITLELDEQSVMPMSVFMSNDGTSVMEMNFTNYQKLSSQEAAPSFRYTPPEGIEVMDLNAMSPQAEAQ